MATLAQSAGHASSGASTVVGAPQKMAQLKYSAASLAGGHVRPPAPSSGARETPRREGGPLTHIESESNREGAASGGVSRTGMDDVATPAPARREALETARDDKHGTVSPMAHHGGDTLGPPTTEPGASRATEEAQLSPNSSATTSTSHRPDAATHPAPHGSREPAEPLAPSQPARPMPQPRATPLESPED